MSENNTIDTTTEDQLKAAEELIAKARLERHQAALEKINDICKEYGVVLTASIVVPNNNSHFPVEMKVGGQAVQPIIQLRDIPKADG